MLSCAEYRANIFTYHQSCRTTCSFAKNEEIHVNVIKKALSFQLLFTNRAKACFLLFKK
uniref:Uncharacterized protein n=1 Tax=Anguilla anguilla TaxID=7936 RepID=A0A0E9XKQ8_ANGAN